MKFLVKEAYRVTILTSSTMLGCPAEVPNSLGWNFTRPIQTKSGGKPTFLTLR